MVENEDWVIRNTQRKIVQEIINTDMKKDKFIYEIESGLGELIKEEPNKIQETPKKPNLWAKFKKLW